MKFLPKHYSYLSQIALPIFLLALISLFFFPQQVILSFRVHWLWLILMILLMITPWGKIRFGSEQEKSHFNWLTTFCLIAIGEIGIVFIYWGIIFLSFNAMPALSSINQSSLPTVGNFLLFSWGFYPWAFFAITAIALSFYSYCQKKPGMLSTLLQPLFNNDPDDPLTIVIDFCTRYTVQFCLAIAIAITSLILIACIANITHLKLSTGPSLMTIFIASLLIAFVSNDTYRRLIHYLMVRKIPPVLIITLFIVVLTITLLVLNALAIFFSAIFVPLHTSITSGWHIDWQTQQLIFSGIWWISWIPLMSGAIVYLAKSYQLRQIVLMLFLAAIICSGLLMLLTHTNIIFDNHFQVINYLLPLIGMSIIGGLFLRSKYLIYLMRGSIPQVSLQKPRALHRYLQSLLQTATFVIVIYLPAGIYGLNLMTFVLLFPMAMIVMVGSVAFVKALIRKT